MKRLVYLLIPIMTISLLGSCGSKVKTYKVTVGATEHLSFTTADDKPFDTVVANHNQDFTFKMKTQDIYCVPSIVDISINDMGPLVITEGYTVSFNGNTEATVTIKGEKIIGNIVISGKGVRNNEYNYKVEANYGLKDIAEGTHSIIEDPDLTIKFETIDKDSNNDKYKLPEAENIYVYFDGANKWISPADSDISEYCSYSKDNGTLTIKSTHIRSNIIIMARASDYPLLNKLTWKDISEISIRGAAPYIFYIGEEKFVQVNGLDHRVRIIGFNYDKDKDGHKIGITFEFANVLCDRSGYSLATQWHDTNNLDNANNNYLDSSIRKALSGEGKGHILWAQKDNDYWSNILDGPYTNKSALDMLPKELKDVMIAPQKKVQCHYYEQWTDEPIINNNGDYDKLFILSPEEMGIDVTIQDIIYPFYLESSPIYDERRQKYQINDNCHQSNLTYIENGLDYEGNVMNYAGYNIPGSYWLRSPYESFAAHEVGKVVYIIFKEGGFTHAYAYSNAYAIAPAFCV